MTQSNKESKRGAFICTLYAACGVLSGICVGQHEGTATSVIMAITAAVCVIAVWTFSRRIGKDHRRCHHASCSDTWPHVIDFACVMEAKLEQKKSKKGGRDGWLALDVTTLRKLLSNELDEMDQALSWGDANAVAEEAADVGNVAMMISDKFAHQYQQPGNP